MAYFFKSIAFLVFFNFWISQVFAVNSQWPTFIEGEYEAIKEVSLHIIKKYSPQSFSYLSIGRSPTPFFRFFFELGLRNHQTIPLSDMRVLTVYSSNEFERIKEKYFQHFDNVLNLDLIMKKKLILMDYVDSGDTLIVAKKLLNEYFKKKGISIEIYSIGIIGNKQTLEMEYDLYKIEDLIKSKNPFFKDCNETTSKDEEKLRTCYFNFRLDSLQAKGVDDFVIVPPDINQKFYDKTLITSYVNFSEYEYYGVRLVKELQKTFKSRPEYEFFGQALRENMNNDSALNELKIDGTL